jgi:hypothetical protein
MIMFDPYHKWLAIPTDQRPPTHYQLLGVAPTETDPEVIEEAVLQRTAHLRAYQLGPHAKECTRLLNEIARAKVVLLNPEKRKQYDAEIARSVQRASPPGRRQHGGRLIAAGAGLGAIVLVAVVSFVLLRDNQPADDASPATPPTPPDANQAAPPPRAEDYVWFDDELPLGATLSKTSGTWHWGDAANFPVFSGKASVKASGPGHHARGFQAATHLLPIHVGDTLFIYVWLDPSDPPRAIMLQFHDGNAWHHRAYWGEDLCIAKGEPDAPHHRHRGALPRPGTWTRLEIPVEAVGFTPGTKITGLSINQFDGTAYYDKPGLHTSADADTIAEEIDVMQGTPKKAKKKKG